MGCHFLLQGIFPTQGLNLCLLNCRWILDSWATLPSESRCLRGESDPTEGPLCSYQATGSSSDTLIHWKGVWRSKYTFREWGNWVQFSRSVVSDSLPPWTTHSMPGLPVHHQLPEFTQTYVRRVGDAIQPSHPLLSPSPPAPNPSQHQGLFQWVNSSHEVAKVLEFQLQHQSFQWTPRTGLLQDGLAGSPSSPRDSPEWGNYTPAILIVLPVAGTW